MRVALDTNVVLRVKNRNDPMRDAILRTLESLARRGAEPVLSAQSLFEMWAVMTRPAEANGWGFTPAQALAQTEETLERLAVLPDPPDLVPRWLHLCTRYEVKGRAAYDARLAAFAVGHGIRDLVTLNEADFRRYDEIRCIVPGVG